ncbi:MAG: hypothetical protein ACRD0F_09455, partial [Acidimicrobiales bacterium]
MSGNMRSGASALDLDAKGRPQRPAVVYRLDFAAPPEPKRGAPRAKATSRARAAASRHDVAPDSHRPHGTYVKYVVEKCRCERCR